MNDWVTTLYVDNPLASPGSPKYGDIKCAVVKGVDFAKGISNIGKGLLSTRLPRLVS